MLGDNLTTVSMVVYREPLPRWIVPRTKEKEMMKEYNMEASAERSAGRFQIVSETLIYIIYYYVRQARCGRDA
jgi:hypothetical protein